jgi:hypothetical protein
MHSSTPAGVLEARAGCRGAGAHVGAQVAAGAAAGDHDAGRGRHQQRRDLADQAVADGEDGVGVDGRRQRHLLAQQAGDEAAGDVDGGDDQAGHGVAAHELAGAVHGAEELDLLLQAARRSLACLSSMLPAARSESIDICLPGRGVEGEAGGHLGDAARALGDDREVDHEEDEEDDDADDQVAADGELAEGLDDVAGGLGAREPSRRMRRVVATLRPRRKRVVMSSSEGRPRSRAASAPAGR